MATFRGVGEALCFYSLSIPQLIQQVNDLNGPFPGKRSDIFDLRGNSATPVKEGGDFVIRHCRIKSQTWMGAPLSPQPHLPLRSISGTMAA